MMGFENIIFAVVCVGCAFIFGLIARWAFKRRDPMHFVAGSTVKPEEITDIPAYNRANGLMWIIYAGCMIVTSLLGLFNTKAAAVLLGVICTVGTVVLIVVYRRIYNRYKKI